MQAIVETLFDAAYVWTVFIGYFVMRYATVAQLQQDNE